MEEGGKGAAVLGGAGDERCPGDDGGGGVKGEGGGGGGREVELGVHVDEVVGEEGGNEGGEGLDDLGMGGAAQPGRTDGDSELDGGGEGLGVGGGKHGRPAAVTGPGGGMAWRPWGRGNGGKSEAAFFWMEMG